jgi:hypothetical protein
MMGFCSFSDFIKENVITVPKCTLQKTGGKCKGMNYEIADFQCHFRFDEKVFAVSKYKFYCLFQLSN